MLVFIAIWWLFKTGYLYRRWISNSWYITYDNLVYCFILNEDGTGQSRYYNSDIVANFTYEITKDKLTIIEENGESDTYLYKIEDQKLNIFDMVFYNNY